MDGAHQVKELVNVRHLHPASLYDVSESAEAKWLANKLEIHYTQTRLLAQHDRDQTVCTQPTMPR